MDIKTSRYFKKLYKEIQERKEEGLLENSSSLTMQRLNSKFTKCYRQLMKAQQKAYSSYITSQMKRKYYDFVNWGYKKSNVGMKPYQINKLKPEFRKELNDRIIFSLSLIKTQSRETMQKLSDRFLNWLNNETQNGNDKSLRETLSISNVEKKQDKHYRFILKDQTQKMFCNFDNIIAEKYEALGFYWRTRRDRRVVGDPSGLYPKVENPDMHGNHYERQGKFYFYKDTWALKSGLIDKSKIEYAEFEDGLPGIPIGCRCYAENVYNLDEIPQNVLTKKGEEYMAEHY